MFVGSGVGAPFGPRCHKGDIMGCGVLFPRNYEYRSDSDDDLEHASGGGGGGGAGGGAANDVDPFQAAAAAAGAAAQNFPHFDYPSDSADDEDWWSDRNYPYGVKVHICKYPLLFANYHSKDCFPTAAFGFFFPFLSNLK